MIKIKHTNCIVAVFKDDIDLLNALSEAKRRNYDILDVFTPFPVHGIEKILGIKRSNLAIAAFVFGCIGFMFGLTMTTYTMTYDWPMNIGGKPIWPFLSFVPILFECTILIASLGMVATFFSISKLGPGVNPVIYEKRATADRFVVLFKDGRYGNDIRNLMTEFNVETMRDDVHVDHNLPIPLPVKLK